MNFSEVFKQTNQLCKVSPDGKYLVSKSVRNHINILESHPQQMESGALLWIHILTVLLRRPVFNTGWWFGTWAPYKSCISIPAWTRSLTWTGLLTLSSSSALCIKEEWYRYAEMTLPVRLYLVCVWGESKSYSIRSKYNFSLSLELFNVSVKSG